MYLTDLPDWPSLRFEESSASTHMRSANEWRTSIPLKSIKG
jgi:hypothetical protein